MKKIFILSSKAGSVNSRLESEINQAYFNRYDFEIYKTEYENHLKDIVKKFADENCIIYICGGDGSLNEATSELINKRACLGLIPAGTANDFAKNFNYQNFSMEKTIHPEIEYCDVIKVNDRYSINILSFGLDTIVLSNTYSILKKFPFLKSSAYGFGVLKSIINFKPIHLDCRLIDADNSIINLSGNFLLGAICNGGYYGGGFNPSPNAVINDGNLEFVLAKELSFFKLAQLIPLYKKGKHLSNPNILLINAKSGQISFPYDTIANVDGTIFKTKFLDFSILKNSIKFVRFEGV